MTLSRRDFLKITSLLTATSLVRPSLELFPTNLSTDPDAKNILIIVFDALSAKNINFYGYPRETMPNLTRLLDRATVYHNHYASSNFTTPGTASLLTGRHAWEHLAIKLSDEVIPDFSDHNIFSFFNDYYKLAYTHNYYADILLSQFQNAITHHEFFKTQFLEYQLTGSTLWFDSLMRNDFDTAMLLKARLNDTNLDGFLYSLLFPNLLSQRDFQSSTEASSLFPHGFPIAGRRDPFILEDGINWTMLQAASMPQPFLAYFHFLPPHDPYNTHKKFLDTFLNDDFNLPHKPTHPVVMPRKNLPWEEQQLHRQQYDEFILYVDSEFNRLFNYLDQQGILENTMVILTSDHGELNERGELGHSFPLMFEPVIKVPLVIFEPGQAERRDIHTLSSCIDLLPTLLHCTDHQLPPQLPGQILPPFEGPGEESPRTIYSIHAHDNPKNSHIESLTLVMLQNEFKIIRYSGYLDSKRNLKRGAKFNLTPIDIDPYYEIFNLKSDPEELNNLAAQPTQEIQVLIDELESFYRQNVEFPLHVPE